MTEKCYFCESTDTKYCNMCKESFCDKHRKDPRRMIEFFKKKGQKFIPSKKMIEEYDEEELTLEELEAVERAEEDYKAGRFYTHKEVGKMLGLDEDEEEK